MSTAYKHLYSCITFLIFIFVINFFKNRVSVSRERESSFRAAAKLKRSGALNRPLPLDVAEDDFFFGFGPSSLQNGHPSPGTYDDHHHWDRLKQYPGRCLDVEVFFLPPNGVRTHPGGRPDGPEGLHYKTVQASRKAQVDEQNSSIYVFLSVLVILLLAASVDIVKHLTAVKTPQEHAQRRLSLQNYQALIREKQKQFRMMKQHCSQPSMSIQRSIDEPTTYPPTFSAQTPYGPGGRAGEGSLGGLQTTTKGPSPLLRRQSVPTLMRTNHQPVAAPGGLFMGARNGEPRHSAFGRRTSVDSFWDADTLMTKGTVSSSPTNGSPQEVRRRVRMLHRH